MFEGVFQKLVFVHVKFGMLVRCSSVDANLADGYVGLRLRKELWAKNINLSSGKAGQRNRSKRISCLFVWLAWNHSIPVTSFWELPCAFEE